jgi:hypothetical protein
MADASTYPPLECGAPSAPGKASRKLGLLTNLVSRCFFDSSFSQNNRSDNIFETVSWCFRVILSQNNRPDNVFEKAKMSFLHAMFRCVTVITPHSPLLCGAPSAPGTPAWRTALPSDPSASGEPYRPQSRMSLPPETRRKTTASECQQNSHKTFH